jgi:hypothetical protein
MQCEGLPRRTASRQKLRRCTCESRFTRRCCEGVFKKTSHIRNEGNVFPDTLIDLNRYDNRDRKGICVEFEFVRPPVIGEPEIGSGETRNIFPLR